MATLSLSIDGMTCVHCTQRARVALRQVPGVSRARVNLTENLAMIEYDPEQTSTGQLVRAVREEGFVPGPAKLRMAVKGQHCASCVTQVEGALNRTPGVVAANMNVATSEVDI